ncbi:MAG: Uma2 family endonuclease [Blastocatellia bacterium]
MSAALLKTIPEPLELDSLVIRLGPLKHRMTDDEFFEFCALNRELRIEMTKEGEMLIMLPVGSEGGHRNYLLTVRFGAWAEADGTGVGFDSSAGFKLPNGAKRAPDLSWIRRERWEAVPARKRKKFAPICPDFVVELRSETDRLELLKAKMEEYIENGTQLGWLIDPIEKKVYIWRPRTRVKGLNHPQTLSGEPLLKGLTLNLAGIID